MQRFLKQWGMSKASRLTLPLWLLIAAAVLTGALLGAVMESWAWAVMTRTLQRLGRALGGPGAG